MSMRRGSQRQASKEQFWRKVVHGFDAKQTTIRVWCAARGVSEPSFYAWRRELRRRDAERAPPSAGRRKGTAMRLLPVRIAPADRSVGPRVIVCRAGLRLHVAIEHLRQVLDVLEGRSC